MSALTRSVLEADLLPLRRRQQRNRRWNPFWAISSSVQYEELVCHLPRRLVSMLDARAATRACEESASGKTASTAVGNLLAVIHLSGDDCKTMMPLVNGAEGETCCHGPSFAPRARTSGAEWPLVHRRERLILAPTSIAAADQCPAAWNRHI